ncbi:hypothetical protein BCR44DRAFT_1430789 [Catenaria anguillulae PL171]|uniref:Uncharacterized protein n=1 Tax=Catenaria anguillulae PL171 TaxID=765915 RepID=A0A1Y2HTH5_9FUNG|nr:hypothetical protein BCR44DRAFT_1430789 [Catenaria anguillulae PL171]
MANTSTKRVYARAIHMPKHKAIWDAFLAPVFPCPTKESAIKAMNQVRQVLDEVHAKLDMLNPLRGKEEPVPSLVDVQRPVPTAVDAGLAIYLAPIVCAVVPPHAVPSNSIACLPLPDPEAFPAWVKAEAKDLIRTHPLAKWAAAYMSRLDAVSGAVCGNGKSGAARGVKPPRYDRAARPPWTQWGAGLMRLLAAGVAVLWLLVLSMAIVFPTTNWASVVAVISASLLGTVALGLAARSSQATTVETRMRITLFLKIVQDAIAQVLPNWLHRKGNAPKVHDAALSLMKKSDSGSRLDDISEEEHCD